MLAPQPIVRRTCRSSRIPDIVTSEKGTNPFSPSLSELRRSGGDFFCPTRCPWFVDHGLTLGAGRCGGYQHGPPGGGRALRNGATVGRRRANVQCVAGGVGLLGRQF